MTHRPSRRLTIVGPAKPYRGGIAQFTNRLADGLRDRGHDVQVITFSRQYPNVLFPGKSQFEPAAKAPGDGDGRVEVRDALVKDHEGLVKDHQAPVNDHRAPVEDHQARVEEDEVPTEVRGVPAGTRLLIDSVNPISWLRTARKIAEGRPDAVLFQYWMPYFAPAYGTIAGRVRGNAASVLAVVHNALPHERRFGDAVLGRYFLGKCEGIVALSDSVAADLRSIGVGGAVRTVAHPVYEHFGERRPRSEARSRLGLADDEDVLLFFGFIRRYKGLGSLIEAMPEIVRARPKARLVVAGEFYEDEASYRDAIRSMGLEDHVLVRAEYIPADDVADYFSAANLVVQPYESATQSGVVQTAFHFERPVVVTDVGGLAEVVPDGKAGFVVPPADPTALARAVSRFFEEGLETAFAEGVRQERKRYSWDSLLDVVEELVEMSVKP